MTTSAPEEGLSSDQREARYQAARRVTLIGGGVNVVLTLFKILAGVLGHSPAMVADGLHSLSDIVSDVVVLVTQRISRQEADAGHPYGHGKFETLGTLFIAAALLAMAGGILVDAVGNLLEQGGAGPPHVVALWAAVVSIVTKEAVYHYTVRVGRRWNNQTLIANAWHSRSDALSSVAALVGIGAAMLGWWFADPVAAILVALILAKVGVDFFQNAMRELTDSTEAIDGAVQERITHLVKDHPFVRSAHALKARRLGPEILVDVHVVVDPLISVSEGHQVAELVRREVVERVEEVTEVLVHVDVADDQSGDVVPFFPLRGEVRKRVEQALLGFPVFSGLGDVALHYTPRGMVLMLTLRGSPGQDVEACRQAARGLRAALMAADDDLREVRLALDLS
ncbi:MAG: cation diffusion facilitator family transporter [Magnetococcus sp. WYHC-3]